MLEQDLLLPEHYDQKGMFTFSSKNQLLSGSHELVPPFDLPNALEKANNELHTLGYHKMYPDTLRAVEAQLENTMDSLLSHLIRAGQIQFTPPDNEKLKLQQAESTRGAMLQAQSEKDALSAMTHLDLGFTENGNDLLHQLPIDLVLEHIPPGELTPILTTDKIPEYLIPDGHLVFSTDIPAIISVLTNANLSHLIKDNGAGWEIVCTQEDLKALVDKGNWKLISDIIRWANIGEIEFFVENTKVLLTSHSAFLAVKEQLEDSIKDELRDVAKQVTDQVIENATKGVLEKQTSYSTHHDTLLTIGKIHNCVAELLSMSFGGFSPKTASRKIGIYLYECLANNKPVVIPYIFSPNYDPQSTTELSPTVSPYRIQRIETFAKIKNVLQSAGLDAHFVFLYDDVPDHLEYKPQAYYADQPTELEGLLSQSFQDLTKASSQILGDTVELHRLSQVDGFAEYYVCVNQLKDYLPADNGHIPLIMLIAQEDMASESRHRSFLGKWICQEQAAKRLAQGWAGIRLCQQVAKDENCLIVTMETNSLELGFFHNPNIHQQLGLSQAPHTPIIINLQKLIEK